MSSTRRSTRVTTSKRSAPLEGDGESPSLASSATSGPMKRPKTTTVLSPIKADKTSLEYLLTEPKSKLCSMEITKLLNSSIWDALPEDRKRMLATLLPSTSFSSYEEALYPYHPSRIHSTDDSQPMDINQNTSPQPEQLEDQKRLEDFNPSSLACGFLTSAAKTFQDHIYSGYFKPKHITTVQEYQESILSGSAHAPWKDEEWISLHSSIEADEPKEKGKGKSTPKAKRAAQAPDIRGLAAAGRIRVGDVIAYSRQFHSLDFEVKKDLLVQKIDQRTGAVTFLLSPSSIAYLDPGILSFPADALSDIPAIDLTPTFEKQRARRRSIDIEMDEIGAERPDYLSITASTSATALESHILPLFEYIQPEQRRQDDVSGWKCFTVWRWSDGDITPGEIEGFERAGRELIGSLHYLTRESLY